MDKERFRELAAERAELTDEEYKQGWHYCPEWDFMFIGPGMKEMRACDCYSLSSRLIDWIYARLGW